MAAELNARFAGNPGDCRLEGRGHLGVVPGDGKGRDGDNAHSGALPLKAGNAVSVASISWGASSRHIRVIVVRDLLFSVEAFDEVDEQGRPKARRTPGPTRR